MSLVTSSIVYPIPFHPIYNFVVERLLNGDVCHCFGEHGAMPMLFVRRKPNDITRASFLDRPVFTLRPAKAGCDDQCLTAWMRMPRCACTRGESYARATAHAPAPARQNNGWIRTERLRRTFPCPLRFNSLNFHP